ncbi:pyridoxal 5'-phosphate synthase [Actinocatenispora sera]|uniref:pyridoxine/pyridoxamine 5'-phosphate oxidase n=1 Tax=Actinocatenispora sera TaxID=390989 RepID=UPI0033E6E9DC
MSLRPLLRALPVFDRPLPTFDPSTAPAEPTALFRDWLTAAIEAGEPEPHAMSIATVDASGLPDSRVLILKDLTADGFFFASESGSAKGRQLAANPQAALGFHWKLPARQVRVRGRVHPADAATNGADFVARPLGSRAASLLGRQSEVLADPAELDEALRTAHRVLDAAPDTVAPQHTVYLVRPVTVEFWQGDAARRHVRLRYRREGDRWRTDLLWP